MSDHRYLSPDHDAHHDRAHEPVGDSAEEFAGGASSLMHLISHNPPTEPPAQRLHDKRLPLHLRQQVALKISRTHGNRHLQRLLAQAAPAVQRQDGGHDPSYGTGAPDSAQAMTIDEIIASKDSDNVNWENMAVILAAPVDKRIACIEMVHGNTWVGPDDEALLEQIWDSLGVGGISTNIDLFKASVNYGVEIENISIIADWPKHFETDTKQIALGYLGSNKTLVEEELQKLGLSQDPGQAPGTLDDERKQRIEETQVAAALVADAMKAEKALEMTQVGWKPGGRKYGVGGAAEVYSPHGDINPEEIYIPQYYMEGPAPIPSTPNDPSHVQRYEVVDTHYKTAKAIIDGYSKRYPGLHTLAANGKLEELAKEESPQKAQAMLGEALRTLLGKIIETQGKIPSNDLEYQSLHPIHAQLKSGKRGSSGTNWTSEVGKFVIENEVKGFEDKEFWQSIALATLGAAAFVVAELATFGTATFWLATAGGLAAGGAQAAISIEKYLDMAQAQAATVSRDTMLVSEGQVSAAALSAALDTVFAFLDVVSPLKRVIRAGQLGPVEKVMQVLPIDKAVKEMGKGAEEELVKRLASAGADAEGKKLIEEGITKLGVERTAKAMGLDDPRKLVEILGKESEAGKRVLDFVKNIPLSKLELDMYMKNLPKLGADLAEGKITQQIADQVVAQMIEQLGPLEVIKRAGGWTKLNHMAILGKGSRAGQLFEAWRQSLVKELDDFMAQKFGGKVKATGTPGHLSDLDTSQLGKKGAGGVTGIDAAAHREAAVSYLSGRLNCSPQELGKLLDTDLFIDPRRIHMYDEIFARLPQLRAKAAQKASAFEQQVIMTQRLNGALERGEQELAEQIRKEMSELGITPIAQMPKLTPETVVLLNREIDELTAKLEEAVLRNDLAQQEKIVLEIANKQAMINAFEKGGYMSGGGVRALVSERDYFPGYNPFKDPGTGKILGEVAGKEMTKAQLFVAALDQLLKLDEYAGQFLKQGAGGVKDLPKTLKNIGKYGERFGEIMQRANLGVAGPNMEALAKMSDEFGAILKGAKKLPADRALREQTLKELADKAVAQLEQLNSSHMALLKKLQAEAGMAGMDAAAEALRSMSATHLTYLLAKDRARQLLYDIVRQYGVQGAKEALKPDEEMAPAE